MSNQEPPGDPVRHRMIGSTFVPSPLYEVAEAVSTATEHEHTVYVERIGVLYRWALAHTGGPYPILRITARFLRCDYHDIIVGCRHVGNGWSVVCKDLPHPDTPDAWALLKFTGITPVQEVAKRIRTELA